jgi:dolichyl-phosphate-mannose-protein mannosyltransferase
MPHFLTLIVVLGVSVVGITIRWWLIPMGSFISDVVDFKVWAEQLASMPLRDFYRLADPPTDYLPGYLYVLAALERVRAWVDGPVSLLEPFLYWIKFIPIIADVLLGLVVYYLSRKIVDQSRALVAFALVVLNPGLIFISAVWGQCDSVGTVITMISLAALVIDRPIIAAITGGIAFLVKPQYTLPLAVVAVAYLKTELLPMPNIRVRSNLSTWLRRTIQRVAFPIIALVATMQLVLLPLSVTLWPGPAVDWTLRSRIEVAGTKFPFASVNAFNLWGTPIAGSMLPDSTIGWFSLSYQSWGLLLFAMSIIICITLVWVKSRDLSMILWACFVSSLAFFVLLTRIHERYLYIAIPIAAILAVKYRWAFLCYIVTSLLYLTNVWYVYNLFLTNWETENSLLVTIASMTIVVLLVICLAITLAIVIAGTRFDGASQYRAPWSQ